MPTGIYNSLLLKIDAEKESLDKEIKKMNKETKLLYKASQHGLSSEVLWQKCFGYKETIFLVKTDQDSVVGGYCPDQWEDTTDMKNSYGRKGFKDIVSGKPFLFYWVNGQIQIIKHRDDEIPSMRSNKDRLMEFNNGLLINADQNKYSLASAGDRHWVHPENTGNLTIDEYNYLYFAGGNDEYFKCLDVEVWGLH